MCLSIPGQITALTGTRAQVDVNGATTEASIELLEDGVAIGDYVLIHSGFAIQKYDPEEALKTLDLFREISRHEGIQPA